MSAQLAAIFFAICRGTTHTLISQAAGTAFGTFSTFGGLGALFDGNTSQIAGVTTAGTSTVGSGYAGKDFGAGATHAISKAIIYPSTVGFDSSGNPTITAALYGKNSAPGNGTDGVLLGSISFTDDTSPHTIISSDPYLYYRYVWVNISGFTNLNGWWSELQLYEYQ